ncbi:hypothetical protein LCGC14_0446840 [marine sediment metagenome]|uniref:Tryptophan synthase beta chain-like PALP domain-containing protein n=1 Tax=marine sediment metagenome TaxID=412755 RepID=A0A0F9VT35_9ZZZZ
MILHPVTIKDGASTEECLGVGNTPLVAMPRSATGTGRWYAKLESHNEMGSMKLRSAYKILTEAQLRVGSTVIESTSGNMGVALAYVGRQLGLRVILVTDPKLSPSHGIEMRQLGATTIQVTTIDKTGGYLLTRLKKVETLCEEHPDWFWVNQYSNPLNPLAFESIAIEIVRDLNKNVHLHSNTTLWYFASVSTGGSLSGSARALRRLCRRLPIKELRIVAVDAEGSAIFGRPARLRNLNGIGSSLNQPPNLQRSLIDDVVIVSDAEAFAACYGLRHADFYVGGSSGAVWAAIHKKAHHFVAQDIVIALFPDGGRMYEETIYSPAWLRQKGFPELTP